MVGAKNVAQFKRRRISEESDEEDVVFIDKEILPVKTEIIISDKPKETGVVEGVQPKKRKTTENIKEGDLHTEKNMLPMKIETVSLKQENTEIPDVKPDVNSLISSAPMVVKREGALASETTHSQNSFASCLEKHIAKIPEVISKFKSALRVNLTNPISVEK